MSPAAASAGSQVGLLTGPEPAGEHEQEETLENEVLRRTALPLLGVSAAPLLQLTGRLHLLEQKAVLTAREPTIRELLRDELRGAAADLAHLEDFLHRRTEDAGTDRPGRILAGVMAEVSELLGRARHRLEGGLARFVTPDPTQETQHLEDS